MDLQQKLNLVFADERRLYTIDTSPMSPTMGSVNVSRMWPGGLLAQQSTPGFVKSVNGDRLLKLHAMLDQSGRQDFLHYLFGQLKLGIPDSQLSYLSFLVLHRLGHTIAAIKAARESHATMTRPGRAGGRDPRPFSNVIAILSGLLAIEYGQMSGQWCEEIRAALGTDVAFNGTLRDRLNQVLLLHLDAELGDANPEIYADRDRVISIWESRFGDPTIPAVIAEIDQYFRDGETSEVRLATCVSRIRTLLAKVALAVAERYAQQAGTAVPANTDEHAVFQHLRGARLIDDHEWNVLRSLYNKASIEGSHSLTGKFEETRLLKNMAYEFLLLLLSRTS